MRAFESRLSTFFLIALFLWTGPVVASLRGAEPHPKEDVHSWNWLSEADQARLMQSIPPAPAPGSATDRDDLAGVMKLQATRTPQDIAEAMADRHFSIGMVAKVLGPNFTRKNYPLTFALLTHGLEDEGYLNYHLKEQYRRLRPYQEHPEVKPLFPVDQYSYPSGHSSGAHVMAGILGGVFPNQKSELEARAEAVGRSRIVAGVHYPSDVAEGKALAMALMDALLANPDYRKQLAAAQAEAAGQGSLP